MKDILFILNFIYFSNLVAGKSLFTLSVIPSNEPVYIGQEVILTCQVQLSPPPLKYSVLFKRKGGAVSEKCLAYKTNKFRIVCEPDGWGNATTFKLYIKSVSWADRGDWFCVYAANLTQQRLEVYARATLDKMDVTSLAPLKPLSSEGGGGSGSAQAAGSGNRDISSVDSTLTNGNTNVLSAGLGLNSGLTSAQHIGLGTRTNPYDLRPGLGLQLTCRTTCGHPQANLSWTVGNATNTVSSLSSPNQVSEEACRGSINTDAMTTTSSHMNVHCEELKLVGLNEVRCTVYGAQYHGVQLSRHIYVLCPGGERPMRLTSGEVVGIAVGLAIALILVFVGCILLRNSRNNYQTRFHGHIPGQRV